VSVAVFIKLARTAHTIPEAVAYNAARRSAIRGWPASRMQRLLRRS